MIEDIRVGNRYRRAYRDGLDRLIAQRQREAAAQSADRCRDIVAHPESYRRTFCEMLGWPLTEERPLELPACRLIPVGTHGEHTAYRVQADVMGVPFYGILFVKEDGKARPLVLCQHGGWGSPELCSDMLPIWSGNYNRMVCRQLEQDVNVFAPQMLLWETRFDPVEGEEEDPAYSVDEIRRLRDRQLKQLGGSIAAFEIYCLQRMLDYFQVQPYVIPDRLGMVGLSYGGFYTLYTMAAEPRLRAGVSACFYNDRFRYNWPDWVWAGSAAFTDNEVAALVYPRALHIHVGRQDDIFAIGTVAEQYAALEAVLPEDQRITYTETDEAHEFPKDDEVIRRFIQQLTE